MRKPLCAGPGSAGSRRAHPTAARRGAGSGPRSSARRRRHHARCTAGCSALSGHRAASCRRPLPSPQRTTAAASSRGGRRHPVRTRGGSGRSILERRLQLGTGWFAAYCGRHASSDCRPSFTCGSGSLRRWGDESAAAPPRSAAVLEGGGRLAAGRSAGGVFCESPGEWEAGWMDRSADDWLATVGGNVWPARADGGSGERR